MEKPKTCCPDCKGHRFQIVTRQMTDVEFDEAGEHKITDGPYGDIDWDDDSYAFCNTCGWSGQIKELK